MGIIQPFSLRHENSFAKSLCCKLIPLAVLSLKLSADELLSVMGQLQALFVVRALYTHEPDIGTRIRKCIGGKIQESERPRPDLLQCWMAWAERARSEGVAYEHVIGAYLAEYQAVATSGRSLSELEMSVVRIISQQTDLMQKKHSTTIGRTTTLSSSLLCPCKPWQRTPGSRGRSPRMHDASVCRLLRSCGGFGVCVPGRPCIPERTLESQDSGLYLVWFEHTITPHKCEASAPDLSK